MLYYLLTLPSIRLIAFFTLITSAIIISINNGRVLKPRIWIFRDSIHKALVFLSLFALALLSAAAVYYRELEFYYYGVFIVLFLPAVMLLFIKSNKDSPFIVLGVLFSVISMFLMLGFGLLYSGGIFKFVVNELSGENETFIYDGYDTETIDTFVLCTGFNGRQDWVEYGDKFEVSFRSSYKDPEVEIDQEDENVLRMGMYSFFIHEPVPPKKFFKIQVPEGVKVIEGGKYCDRATFKD